MQLCSAEEFLIMITNVRDVKLSSSIWGTTVGTTKASLETTSAHTATETSSSRSAAAAAEARLLFAVLLPC
jgi:hypothetical protein